MSPIQTVEAAPAPYAPHVDFGSQPSGQLGANEEPENWLSKEEIAQPEAEQTALESAMARLSRTQSCYGFWSDAPEYEVWLEERPKSPASGLELDETALSALALLCLAADGQSQVGEETENSCRIALTFLLSRGNGAGWFSQPTERNRISTQALMIMALAKLRANSLDRSLEPILGSTIAAALSGRGVGGWPRCYAESRTDVETTGWMLAALKDARECGFDSIQSDWFEACLAELEAQARNETGACVLHRAIYLACVEPGSEQWYGPAFKSAQEAVVLRANHSALVDPHEMYWVARSLKSSAADGIWHDSLRDKAQALTPPKAEYREDLWQGGDTFRLGMGIRILQMLR